MINREITEKWIEFVRKWQYQDCHGAEKYMHFYSQFEKFRELIYSALPEKRKLRTLDISTGMGFFPYALKWIGHNPVFTECYTPHSQIYHEAHAALGLPAAIEFEYPRRKFIPLPENIGKFDMISSMACAPMSFWNLEDWAAFLKDCANHLNPGGFVLLSPNKSENIVHLESLVDLENKRKTSQLTYYIVR